MEPERGGMNRTERALLVMAVLFTVLSSLFTHLCWELKAVHQLCASVSGCVAMVSGMLCLACLDMWRMGPAGSHTVATLLTQYLRTRAWGYKTRAHWTARQDKQKQKMVLNTLQRTGLFHKRPSKGIFSRLTLEDLLEDFHQHVPLCEPCSGRENENTNENTSKFSDSNQVKLLRHYGQLYRYSVGITKDIATLKRIARLRNMEDSIYSSVSKDESGMFYSSSQFEKYYLGNNNVNLDSEYKHMFRNSATDYLSLKETYGSLGQDIGHRPPNKDVLWLSPKEGESVVDMIQRQALLLLLEEDLAILQSPDVPTLTNFLSYIEQNLIFLCGEIRKHCNNMNSKKRSVPKTNKRSNKTKHRTRNMSKEDVRHSTKTMLCDWPASSALSGDYLRRREAALRAALEPEIGVSCLASRVWPSLRLVSVLRWDPASLKDLLYMRVTNCRLPEVTVSVWLPPGGGVWGHTCSACGVTSPRFQLHIHDGFIEYLDVRKGDVSQTDQLELGVHYELVVTTLFGAVRRRTGHIVQVARIHENSLPCFQIISNYDISSPNIGKVQREGHVKPESVK